MTPLLEKPRWISEGVLLIRGLTKRSLVDGSRAVTGVAAIESNCR